MKLIFKIACCSLILLYACSSNDEKNTQEEPAQVIEQGYALFPSDWILLTNTDSGFIIFNCYEKGNLEIAFKEDSTGKTMLWHGTQEDYLYKIIDLQQIQDTIKITANSFEQVQVFNLILNDSTHKTALLTAQFGDQNVSYQLANQNSKSEYYQHIETCKECLGKNCEVISEE